MTKSFPYRSFKLTMQFRILFHRQHLTSNNKGESGWLVPTSQV